MGRTGRVDEGGTIGKKALAGDGFRGQERAIGHRGDLGAARRRDGQQGSKNAGRKVGERSPLIKVELMANYASRTHCFRLPLPTALGHSEQGCRWGWGVVGRYPPYLYRKKKREIRDK